MQGGRRCSWLQLQPQSQVGAGSCGLCSISECLCHQQPDLTIPGPADPWAGAPVRVSSTGLAERTWGPLWRVRELCGVPTSSKTSWEIADKAVGVRAPAAGTEGGNRLFLVILRSSLGLGSPQTQGARVLGKKGCCSWLVPEARPPIGLP